MSHRQFRSGSCQSLVQPTRSNSHVSFAQDDEVIILPSDDERSTMPKKHRRRAAKGATTRLRRDLELYNCTTGDVNQLAGSSLHSNLCLILSCKL